MKALQLEQEQKLEESLKLVFLMIQAMNQINKAAKAGDIKGSQIKRAEILDKSDQPEPEEIKEPAINCYSDKLKKEVLERAVFLAVSLGDFNQACEYQTEVVAINELIYEPNSHPLQGL